MFFSHILSLFNLMNLWYFYLTFSAYCYTLIRPWSVPSSSGQTCVVTALSVNDCQITLPNITLSRPHVSGCHSLSECCCMDGCTCAYTQNKHGQRDWKSGLPVNKAVCCAEHSWTLFPLPKYRSPPTTVWRCVVFTAPLFSSLLSQSDTAHYSMVIHALICCRDDAQVWSAEM